MKISIQTGKVDNFTASVEEGWYTVEFETPFAENTIPVVFAQIQTRNGADTPGLRLQNVSNTGFEVRMEEVILHNATSEVKGDLGLLEGPGKHPNAETLAWMAMNS